MLRYGSMFILLAALAAGLAGGGCSDSGGPTLEESVQVFLTNDLDRAESMLARSAKSEPANPDARAWYAECLRRQGDFDRAYDEAAAALALDPKHSFAHTVLGDLFSPRLGSWERVDADSAWTHFLLAVEADPDDGNAWSSLWVHSMRHCNWDIENLAGVSMIESGFLTQPLLAYNRWQLEHLPANAILITNGDMDTYPAIALQEMEEVRPDVAIINRSLLNLPWYVRSRAIKYQLELPFSDDELAQLKPYRGIDGNVVTQSDQIIAGWLKMQKLRDLDRPLCAAVTLSKFDFTEDALERRVYCGSYCEYMPRPLRCEADIGEIERSLKSLRLEDFEGAFASEVDRSPVRRTGTDKLAQNITEAMLRYAKLLARDGRLDEAREALERAERFDSGIRASGAFDAEFDSLREELGVII